MRLPVPVGLWDWWEKALPAGPLQLRLMWRGSTTLNVGTVYRDRMLLRLDVHPNDFAAGAERTGRMLAKALTRAGWRRPAIDPGAMLRLLELRRGAERLEFILDTNSLVEGIGHWLVDHFADRCDLVTTAVTLRELQDVNGRAAWDREVGKKKGNNDSGKPNKDDIGKVLGARQLYLAAHRLRERTGYPRVLWRELEVDDAALLLSRGSAGEKSSEADTLLLRAVRRSIHDRVNNLERFFVTGDTALARRAATELPPGSVIAAQVRPVTDDEVLFPCSWWPNGDQGVRIVRHPARLVWELLCLADQVALRDDKGREWTFQAFDNPMWPTDYLEPWVDVTLPTPPPAHASTPEPGPALAAASGGDVTVEAPAQSAPFWREPASGAATLHDNLRIPAKAILALLEAIALSKTPTLPVPSAVSKTSASNHHIRLLLEGLELGTLNGQTITVHSAAATALRQAWSSGDLDAVYDLVSRWAPLSEWATREERTQRPDNTQQVARALAALLGQGAYHPITKKWVHGGCRPSITEMKQAVRAAVPAQPPLTVPIFRLLVDVFLQDLGVAPARVERRWHDLWRAGVFDGFEAREGGTSTGSLTQEVADLQPAGWTTRTVDLESVAGTRDLVFKGV